MKEHETEAEKVQRLLRKWESERTNSAKITTIQQAEMDYLESLREGRRE